MISVQIFDSPDKNQRLADYTTRIHPSRGGGGLTFGSGPHGFAACSLPLVPMGLRESLTVLGWPGVPHVVVSDNIAGICWEGRLEDREQVAGGVGLTALGYARALGDVPYTALWSETGYGRWRVGVQDDAATMRPERWQSSAGVDGLYAAPRKGEDFSSSHRFAWYYEPPDDAVQEISRIEFDWELNLPTGWTARLDAESNSAEWIETGSGALDSGSETVTLTASDEGWIRFLVFRSNATAAEYTGETGDSYLLISNIRVMGVTGSAVAADDIAAALAAFVNGVNDDQLSDSAALIEASTDDLYDELYGDEYPADILDRLVGLTGFEWGVWHNQLLHFREKGSWGKTYYVDVTSLQVQKSLEPLRNSAYGAYQDANGRTLRTDVADDEFSQEQHGLIRRTAVSVRTTDETQAEAHRDAYLADNSTYAIRASVVFTALYNESGGRVPLTALRAHDTIVLRNLPPMVSADVATIREFMLARCEYQAAPEVIWVEPDVPIPTLVTMIAREGAGLS